MSESNGEPNPQLESLISKGLRDIKLVLKHERFIQILLQLWIFAFATAITIFLAGYTLDMTLPTNIAGVVSERFYIFGGAYVFVSIMIFFVWWWLSLRFAKEERTTDNDGMRGVAGHGSSQPFTAKRSQRAQAVIWGSQRWGFSLGDASMQA